MRPRTAAFVFAGVVLVVLLFASGTGRSQSAMSALPLAASTPAGNPSSPARIALGRQLFWDPVLSGNKDVACGTCHHPRFGYAENLDLSIGVDGIGLGGSRRFGRGTTIPFVKRNSQTILNVAFNGIDETGRYTPSAAPMFWDMRAVSLEQQALVPIKTHEEMRGNAYPEDDAVAVVVGRLAANAEYRTLFSSAFGGSQAVTADNLGKALAAFQRSLTATQAPFDRYMRGDANAMNASELRGMRRFERIGCANCHKGPMFSDFQLHVLGVPDNPKLPASDAGRDVPYAFRTASLRNLTMTAPYMHSGVFNTLEDVLEFYDDVRGRGGRRGGGVNRSRNPNVSRDQLDPLLQRLRGVDDDDPDLIAFLRALSDEEFDRTLPTRVPSGLPVGGRIQ
ncbi:MAG: cytochrome-c peroxidase [Acidobacteria bacterium]|nr:cytochrome-c peroxidase [Acidobacteriota bacterium]